MKINDIHITDDISVASHINRHTENYILIPYRILQSTTIY